MTATCPQCGDELDVPDEFAARPVRCGSCQSVFTPAGGAGEPRRSPESTATRQSNASVWGLAILTVILTVPCTAGLVLAVIGFGFPEFQPASDDIGKFQAGFPGSPVPVNRKDGGRLIRGLDLRRDFPPEKYFAYYFDSPEAEGREPEAVLAETAGNLSEFIPPGAREVRREAATHDGRPALDLLYETDDAQEHAVIVRLVLGKAPVGTPRLYVAGISGSFGPHDIRVRRFFGEFKLTK